MSDNSQQPLRPEPSDRNSWHVTAKEHTAARIFLPDAGGLAYSTPTWLELRRDHAAAVDAVHDELDLERDFDPTLTGQRRMFVVQTDARSKSEYLLRPDRGRRLNDAARSELARQCPVGADLQLVVGDGLSAAAVVRQVPRLLPLLEQAAGAAGWQLGQTFVVRYCRVGVMNDVGDLLDSAVVVLLIGERPGLATAESLSAYMAYRPRGGHTDAQRNLISNIHDQGVSVAAAATRIMALTAEMRRRGASGYLVKEELPRRLP